MRTGAGYWIRGDAVITLRRMSTMTNLDVSYGARVLSQKGPKAARSPGRRLSCPSALYADEAVVPFGAYWLGVT
jgi:hypothetical protein